MLSVFEGGKFKVTSPYGNRMLNGKEDYHSGIDLVGISSKKVCSVIDGTVAVSNIITDKNNLTWQWGNYVAILGTDGNIIYYCHLSKRLVTKGQKVKKGDVIGIEGNTGYSFGSHCHFEVRNGNNKVLNPAEYLGIENKEGEYEVIEKLTDNIPAEWAKEAVEWAIKNGILQGGNNGNLMLREPCTREQMCVFLYRFAEKLGLI